MSEIDLPELPDKPDKPPKPIKPKKRRGFLINDGTGAAVHYPVWILSETPGFFRIRPRDRSLRLPSTTRLLFTLTHGALVPKADVEETILPPRP